MHSTHPTHQHPKRPMKNTGIRAIQALLGVSLLIGAIAWTPALHFKLDKAEPASGSETVSPDAVTLWFSQVPQAKSTSIRLLDSAGEPVTTGEVTQDGEDGKIQSIQVANTLAPGAYTVAWRSMASDGHVVRDDFAFTVMAETRH